MDALVDLTGGLAECYDVTEANPDTYRHLLRAHKSGAFITCSKKVVHVICCLEYVWESHTCSYVTYCFLCMRLSVEKV